MLFSKILESSFKNFHAKGLHYLCLQRTELVTVKAYFFEDEIAGAHDVVIPHNHRYDFVTECLSGHLTDIPYEECNPGHGEARIYNKFNFHTPLNGGEGFVWEKPVCLLTPTYKRSYVKPGQRLYKKAEEIHTIQVKPDTIILLTQLQDREEKDVPSKAYQIADADMFPNTSGLYDKMDSDTAYNLLANIETLGVDTQHIRFD
jgi:hypothetical protein